jgi:hypothetical protein
MKHTHRDTEIGGGGKKRKKIQSTIQIEKENYMYIFASRCGP